MRKDLFSKLRYVLAFLLLLSPLLLIGATDADVTVTYTIEYINIADNATTVAFGTLSPSGTSNTSLELVEIANNSTTQIDLYIGVTGATWTGGTAHTHSDTATPGADTVGLYSHNGTGSWGDAGDVIVEYDGGDYTGWGFLYENCPIDVDTTYGLGLRAPTSTSDSVEKTNTVRVTAVSG